MAQSSKTIEIKERMLLWSSITRLGAALCGGAIGVILTGEWSVALFATIGVYLTVLSLSLSLER